MNFVIVPSPFPLLPRTNDAITLATEKQLLAQLQFHLKIAFCTKMFAVLGKMFLTSFMFVRGRENMKTNGAWAFSFGKEHVLFFLQMHWKCFVVCVLVFVFRRCQAVAVLTFCTHCLLSYSPTDEIHWQWVGLHKSHLLNHKSW